MKLNNIAVITIFTAFSVLGLHRPHKVVKILNFLAFQEVQAQSGKSLATFFNRDNNIESHPNVLYATQWEGSNWQEKDFPQTQKGYSWTKSAEKLPSYDPTVSFIEGQGGSFKLRQIKGKGYPTSWRIYLPENKRNFNNLYMRWYQKFENDYEFYYQKGMRLGSRDNPKDFSGCGGIGGHSYISWGVNMWKKGDSGSNYYVPSPYFYNDNGKDCGSYTSAPISIDKRSWQSIEIWMKLNTPGKPDGEGKIWVNGKLSKHVKEIRFRDSSSENLGIHYIEFDGGNGARSAPKNQSHWIDNLVVATKYIGPIGK